MRKLLIYAYYVSLQKVEVEFEQITCPEELLLTPCRTDGTWPEEPIPDTCAFSPSFEEQDILSN